MLQKKLVAKKTMNKKNIIHPLFSILVGEFHNPNHQEIKNELTEFFRKYESENNISRDGVENYNLYESKYNLHKEKNDALFKVFTFMAGAFTAMIKNVNKAEFDKMENKNPKLDVEVKNSWFIRYNKGGFVMPHDHGQCSMSCVYYVKVADDANFKNGSTYFLRPYNRGSTHNDFGGLKYVNNHMETFKAEEGKLIIWPSFMLHGSKPYLSDKERIIISANVDVNISK